MRTDFILGLTLPHRLCKAILGALPSGSYILRFSQFDCGKEEPSTASREPWGLSPSPLLSRPFFVSVCAHRYWPEMHVCGSLGLFRLEGSWKLTLDPSVTAFYCYDESDSLIKNRILFPLLVLEMPVYNQWNPVFWGLIVRQHMKVGAWGTAKPLPHCQRAKREEGEGAKA